MRIKCLGKMTFVLMVSTVLQSFAGGNAAVAQERQAICIVYPYLEDWTTNRVSAVAAGIPAACAAAKIKCEELYNVDYCSIAHAYTL